MICDVQNMSIVGSESVFDIQLINGTARDLFAERLFLLVLSCQADKKGSSGAGGFAGNDSVFDLKLLSS